MTRWSYLILVVYIVLAVNAQGKPDDTTTKEPLTTTTTKETTTKPTTTSTSTTTTSTSTTTQKTSTTTETTPAPTPKPTPPPTPTPTPAPPKKYPKNLGHWLLNETSPSNVSCLVLDAALELKLPNITTPVDVPLDANLSGKCGETEITATLTWITGNDSDSNELTLTFGKKGSNFLLNDVSVSLPGQDISGKLENATLYETPLNRTYKCISESPVKLSNQVELKVASMRVEAFRSTPFTVFNKEYECSSDDVSTVVPFAVGISLALLVVIVLVAYLIGRRRSRARGYQSV